jgi:hypothetical protein
MANLLHAQDAAGILQWSPSKWSLCCLQQICLCLVGGEHKMIKDMRNISWKTTLRHNICVFIYSDDTFLTWDFVYYRHWLHRVHRGPVLNFVSQYILNRIIWCVRPSRRRPYWYSCHPFGFFFRLFPPTKCLPVTTQFGRNKWHWTQEVRVSNPGLATRYLDFSSLSVSSESRNYCKESVFKETAIVLSKSLLTVPISFFFATGRYRIMCNATNVVEESRINDF